MQKSAVASDREGRRSVSSLGVALPDNRCILGRHKRWGTFPVYGGDSVFCLTHSNSLAGRRSVSNDRE